MAPGHVTAIGPGLVAGKVDEPANFTILTNDAGNLALAVEGPSKVEIFSKENENGTCSVSYLPTAPGEYTVTVKFNNQHIPESPFIANIAVKRFYVNTKKVFCQNEGSKSTSDREENIEAYKEPVVLNQFVNCNFDGVTKLNMNSGDVNNNQLKDVWFSGPDQDGEIHFERNFSDTNNLSKASDWDQKLLRDKLEFHGIPKTKSENLRKTIISLVERLGVRLSDDDIVDCHRVPCRENPLHPIVVAKFADFRTRDLIHERRKRFAGVTDFGIEGMTSLFINESFTKERRGWLYKARQLLKSKVIAFLWTKFGKIWMRKSKDSKKIEVNAETVRAQLQES